MSRTYLGLTLVAGLIGVCLAAAPAAAEQSGSESGWTGAQYYRALCSKCHEARPPVERSDAQWKIIMGHMRSRANLTGEEARKILEYLQASN